MLLNFVAQGSAEFFQWMSISSGILGPLTEASGYLDAAWEAMGSGLRITRITGLLPFLGTAFVFTLVPLRAELESDDAASELPAKTKASDVALALGYESNIFQVNGAHERPTADWLANSKFELTAPLPDRFEFRLFEASKVYLRQSNVDEYLLKPSLAWIVAESGATTVTLEAHAAGFRERIVGAFERSPDRAYSGLGAGGSMSLQSRISKTATFLWKTEGNYQWFDGTDQNNFQFGTDAKLEFSPKEDLKVTLGTKWDFQHYVTRPPDTQPAANPRGLGTLEGRGVLGSEVPLGRHWHIEAEVNGGTNIDLTNGYYDAGVVAARTELRWEGGRWEFKTAAEVEWVWFANRPANLGSPNGTLRNQEYVFEGSVEFALTDRVKLRATDSLHLQRTNSDESRADSTLNQYIDNTIIFGFDWSF